jgi:small-conductance mechanosensitive channel
MSRKIPSKDEALEALDFIVNVLKEHEKDLDRLINELGTITERMGDTGELSGKVEKVEERLSTLQNEITNLITHLSASREQLPTPQQALQTPAQISAPPVSRSRTQDLEVKETRGPPVVLRCKIWEDFQSIASQAQTLSFMYREQEKLFQVDAVKDNQIITYSGPLPKETALLKMWLSKQLDVPEKKILEGILAIG